MIQKLIDEIPRASRDLLVFSLIVIVVVVVSGRLRPLRFPGNVTPKDVYMRQEHMIDRLSTIEREVSKIKQLPLIKEAEEDTVN